MQLDRLTFLQIGQFEAYFFDLFRLFHFSNMYHGRSGCVADLLLLIGL